MLTVSDIGDQIPTVAQQQSYGEHVRRAGKNALLRQTYVESVGHCAFSPAEQHAALRRVVERLDTSSWPSTDARPMIARASELGADSDPRYTPFDPPTFNRPYPD